MDEVLLSKVANAVVARFKGHYPPGYERGDVYNDAVVLILQLAPQHADRAPQTNLEAFLIVRTWGDLMDRYEREFRRDAGRGTTLYVAETVGHGTPAEERRAEDRHDSTAVAMDVRAALSCLSDERERQVMQLTLDGMTQAEVGSVMGFNQPYISQIMSRAKVKLRELLAAYAAPKE